MSANVRFTYYTVVRQLLFRLDIVVLFISLCATVFCVIFKGKIESELLTFSLQIVTDVCVYFSVSVRFATEVYNYLTSA